MTLIILKDRPKRSTWRGKLLKFLVVVALIVVALYFVVTSQMFLQRVILPQVGNAIKADITVASAQVSPFQQIILRDLKINPRGAEPLLEVKEIRLRYSLFSIIRGKIEVEEAVVESPVLTVIEEADGRSNLDGLLKLAGSSKKEASPKSESVPQVNVKLVALNNATVRFTRNHIAGFPDVVEVSGLTFSVHDLKNGQSGKLEVAANLSVDQMAQATVAAGSLRAKLGGGFTFDLTPDLKPALTKGSLAFTVGEASGALAELAMLAVLFDCEATSTEVKQVALRFAKADATLGEVRLSGPLALAKREGKLKLEVLSLDRRVLNLAGAARGIDFGSTTISSTTEIELAKGGEEISVGGRLNVANFQITQAGQTSPTLDLRCDYAVTVDQAMESAVVKFLNLSGTQNSQLFLQSELPSPLTITWGKTASAPVSDGVFNLTVTGWNLADWQAFAGEAVPKGVVNTKLKLASQQNGKQLQIELDGGVEKFAAKFGGNQVMPAEIRWQARAQATDLKQFKLDDYRLEIAQQGQPALVVTATGTFDGATQDADLQVAMQATLARLLVLASQPGVNVSAGAVDFKSHIVSKGGGQMVTGQLALTDFTGGPGGLQLTNYGATFDFDLAMKGSTVELRKLSGVVRAGQQVGGHVDASGKMNIAGPMTGEVAVKLTDFNQDGLRPFFESALDGKKLVSVALNTAASVNLGARSDTAIKADLSVTNLVVSDPLNPQPVTPLQARVQVDVTMDGLIAQIRQCQISLTPTARAKNDLNLTGKVDALKSDAITGNLKLSAAALDVTRYYDLMVGKPQTNAPTQVAKSTPATQTTPPPNEPEQEPAALTLPFQNFNCDVDIARFYLREMDIANLQATAKIDGGHVVLKPFQMKVNGAPVSASVDADLGVPGYRYAIDFNARSVPLAPLVNTFQPDRFGQIGGQLIASMDIAGAGITGGSLQTNLTGQFNVLATNLNLSINNVRNPILNGIINTIVSLPELISLLTGKRDPAQKMRWADELTAKPIDGILARGIAGGGRIQLQAADINSAAFRVQTSGDITLAQVLTNSLIHFPVHIALGRPYAAKIGIVSAEIPTNAAYVLLPDFLTIKGTVGKVEKDISELGLFALTGKTAGGLGKKFGLATGDSAKSILGAVEGLLGNKPINGATNSLDSTTNGVAEPAKKSGGLLNLFKKSKPEDK